MKGMSVEQRKSYVQSKSADRTKIQTEIQSLNKKRQEYIAAHKPNDAGDASLDGAMIKSIKETARTKNLNWQ